MEFLMALPAENHGLPPTFDHMTLPYGLAFQFCQFPDMVDLDGPLSRFTPFTCLRMQAFSQLRALLCDGDALRVAPVDGIRLELAGGGEQFIFPACFSLLFHRHHKPS